MLPNLIPSLMPLTPQADTMLSLDGGAIAALAVLVVLALGVIRGVANELRQAAAPSTMAPVRVLRPTSPRALAA